MILCLNHIENDETSNSKTTSQAKALLLNILDFEFVFGVELLNVILIQTSKLSSYLLKQFQRATVNQVIQGDMKELIDKFGSKGRDSHFF